MSRVVKIRDITFFLQRSYGRGKQVKYGRVHFVHFRRQVGGPIRPGRHFF